MTHNEKLKRMYEHLPALGISPYTAAPPLYRFLWLLGIEVAPPIFGAFLPIALFMGTFFACGWGFFMWFFLWSKDANPSTTAAILVSLLAGALFGLIMAAYLRYKTKKYGLPPWSQYTGQQP
jgi:hypothetical protein